MLWGERGRLVARCFFCCLGGGPGGGGGAGGWRGWGRGAEFFSFVFFLFERVAFLFLLFGRFYVCCWDGERQFTHLPACLAWL